MPTIDLTDDEHAAVTAAIRRLTEEDKFPHAPRLDPLRSALAKFEAPKAPPPGQGGKRAAIKDRDKAHSTTPARHSPATG
jgi:hypothetical protein